MSAADGWYGGMIPVLKKEETIDEYLYAIKTNLLKKEDTIEYLQKQLKKVKDEAYASEEMQRMKKELEEAKSNLYRGFSITKEQSEDLQDWIKNHDTSEHQNPNQYHGAVGGGYEYKFYPTSIGTFGACICNICKRKALDYAYKSNEYNHKKYEEYMRAHHAQFNLDDF